MYILPPQQSQNDPCYRQDSQWFPFDVSVLKIILTKPSDPKVVFTRFNSSTSNDVRFFTLCPPDSITHHTYQVTGCEGSLTSRLSLLCINKVRAKNKTYK